jgi:Anti-sigma-K factor rskA
MSAEHDAVRDLLAPAALGAAAPAEMMRVEDHAARCAVCAEDLAGMRVAAGALGTSLPATDPPPRLRSALMAQVRQEAAARRPSLKPRRARLHRLAPRMTWPALTGALAAAALVLFGLDLAARAPESAHVTAISVHGTASAPHVRGEVLLLPDRDMAVVRLERLGPAGARRAYELWAIRDGRAVSAGFLRRAEAGVVVLAATDLAGVDSLAVTREPVSNRAAPTGPPLAEISLPAQV